jgi:excisionase family DNA binding protein
VSALADEMKAALREVLREELPRALAALQGAATPAPPPRGRLSVAEAAALAHRHQDTIRRAIRAGALKAMKPAGGREWIIEAAEVERWTRSGTPASAVDIAAEVDKAVARARG